MKTPCPHCSTTIKHGTRFGCCSSCGGMFVGQAAFDRHQTIGPDGRTACRVPQTLTRKDGSDAYRETTHQGYTVYALNSGPSPWADREVSDR